MTDAPSALDDGSTPASSQSPDAAAFERIDWDAMEPSRCWLTPEQVALALGLVALGAVYAVHHVSGDPFLLWRWAVGPADWLLLVSAIGLVAYGLVPLARNRERSRRLLARLAARRPTLASVSLLAGVTLLACYAVVLGFRPRLTVESGTPGADQFQPPPGFTVPYVEAGANASGRQPTRRSPTGSVRGPGPTPWGPTAGGTS